MKRWWLAGVVFLAVVAVLLLAGGAAPQSPCYTADALREAKLYEEAQKNYTDLLKINPNLDCAKNGTWLLKSDQAEDFYALGQAYEKTNQSAEARNAYIEALKKDPTSRNASEALDRVSANKSAAVVETPPGRSVFLWGYIRGWLEQWGQTAGEIIIFLLALYALVFKIIPWACGSCKPRLDIQDFDKGATGLDIGKGVAAMVEESLIQLDNKNGHVKVHMVAGPVAKLEIPVEIKSASSVIKALSQAIEWLFPPNVITISGYLEKPGDRGAGITLSIVNSRTGDILDNVTIWQKDYDPIMEQSASKDNDPVSYYRLTEPVAAWLLFQLSAPSKVKKGFLCETITITCTFFQIFTSSKVRNDVFSKIKYKISPPQKDISDTDKKKRTRRFKFLNTEDWQSYAYFQAGVRWHEDGKKDKARQLYLKSLKRDKGNYGALFNMGVMYLEDKNYEHALFNLKMVIDATKPKPKEEFPIELAWYQAMYQLAATYQYMGNQYRNYLFKTEEGAKKLESIINEANKAYEKKDSLTLKCSMFKAGEAAATLVKGIGEIINVIQKNDNSMFKSRMLKSEGDARKLVEIIKKTIDAVQKNNDLAFRSCISEAEKLIKTLIDAIKTDVDAIQKNKNTPFKFSLSESEKLAEKLLETTKKAIDGKTKDNNHELKEFLEEFYPMAIIIYAGILISKGDEMSEESAKLMIEGIKPYENLRFRSRYNLACYYSDAGEKNENSRKENYKNSLDHLMYSLELGGHSLVRWAQIDPSLRGVREFDGTKSDFIKIIKKYEPQSPVDLPPLAALKIIGRTFADKLKDQGVNSSRDMILMAGDSQAREELAEKLGVTTQLLRRWALLADMMRIVENVQYVNLLVEAGVESLDALKSSDPCELAISLNKINESKSLVSQAPSIETVRQWVQEAKKNRAKDPIDY